MDISNADTPRVDKRLTSLKWFAVFVGTTKELHLPALSDIVLTWGKTAVLTIGGNGVHQWM